MLKDGGEYFTDCRFASERWEDGSSRCIFDPRAYMDDLLDACAKCPISGMSDLRSHVIYTASRAIVMASIHPAIAFVYVAVAAVIADGDGSDSEGSKRMASDIADAALLLGSPDSKGWLEPVSCSFVPPHLRRLTIQWLLHQTRKNASSVGPCLERVICALASGALPPVSGAVSTPTRTSMIPISARWFPKQPAPKYAFKGTVIDVVFSTKVGPTTCEFEKRCNDVFGVAVKIKRRKNRDLLGTRVEVVIDEPDADVVDACVSGKYTSCFFSIDWAYPYEDVCPVTPIEYVDELQISSADEIGRAEDAEERANRTNPKHGVAGLDARFDDRDVALSMGVRIKFRHAMEK